MWTIMLLLVPFSSPLEANWILEQPCLVQRSQVRFSPEWPLRLQVLDHTRPQRYTQNRLGISESLTVNDLTQNEINL